jgi:SNF2 family DNA or RNA helicase
MCFKIKFQLMTSLITKDKLIFSQDPPEDAVVTMCGHVFCYQCVHEFLSSDETTCPTTGCRDSLNTNSIFSKSTLKACVSDNAGPSGATSPDPFSDEKQTSISKSSYISSKIKATIDNLIQVCGECDNAGPFKAIVFSQWTSMLDLLELSLNQYMIQYRRLDGTMTLVARDRAVKDFNTDPEVFFYVVLFVSGNDCTKLCCYLDVLDFRLYEHLVRPD